RISDEGLQLTIAGVASDGLEVDLTVLTDPQLIDEQLPKSLRRASLELWRLEAGGASERLARLEIDLRVEEQLEPVAGARESCTFFLRNRPKMPEKCFDRYKLKAAISSGTFEVRLLHLGEVLRASRISITLD
ncbi:MAG: hypothetical protein V3R73_00880, partial [Sphingomonadales bacterium]